MTQSTITIGYQREDGDIAVLATLNNNDELLDALVTAVRLRAATVLQTLTQSPNQTA